jgi:tight adherence protein B
MSPTLITAILVFVAVALGTVSLVLLGEWIRDLVRARSVVKQLKEFAETGVGESAGLIRAGPGERARWLEELTARSPRVRDLEGLLRQAGSGWSLQGFLFLSFGVSVGLGLASFIISRSLFLGGLMAVLGGVAPYLGVRRRATRRLYKFEEQLPDAIDLMGRAIRAGHPLTAGFKMVADETSAPISTEFRQIFEEQRFGLAFEDSMFAMADRVPIPDVRILNTAILIHRQVGGNLAEVLDNLAYVIRERFKLRRQLRVITAQGRLSGYVLAALPIALGVVIFLLNREYMMTLFERSLGRLMVISAAVLQTMGYLWIRRIVNIEF